MRNVLNFFRSSLANYWRETQRFIIGVLIFILFFSIAHAIIGDNNILLPEAPGIVVNTDDSLTIDSSNSNHGYIMAKAPAGNYKLRITIGANSLTYDIKEGRYEPFPLQYGNGTYIFELFKNVSGNKYSQEGKISIDVEMENPNEAFLYPNQYVNYGSISRAVLVSKRICRKSNSDEEKFEIIRNYILSNFTYDFDKAKTVTNGTLPDIDYLFHNDMGICQDISAATACMLRVQGIPTKLVIGYAGKYYHAWNSVFIDGEWKQIDLTLELGGIQSGLTYTVERIY